jgi:hypothetical protein
MKEEGIFWRGGAPGAKDKKNRLADDEQFVAAIREACETAGCRFQRFISAQGPYGTWLAEFERDGQAQRVLWNGKDECMVLQIKLSQGGWDDAITIEVATYDQLGFVAGVSDILMAEPEK